MHDDSRETSHGARTHLFGKYADCVREAETGLWYAQSDMVGTAYAMRPGPGALPRPEQDTALLTAIAQSMHEEAATRTMLAHFRRTAPRRGFMARLRAAVAAFRLAMTDGRGPATEVDPPFLSGA